MLVTRSTGPHRVADESKTMTGTFPHFIRLCVLLWLTGPLGLAVAEGRLEPDPVFGGQVYVEEAGDPSKETVVLVHGLGGGASNDWQGVAQRLQSHYHVLTFDLPGFGHSSTGEGDYTPTRYARLLRLLAKRHGIRPFHLVGHSMGGTIALRYAARYPDDLKTLTLVGAAGILHRMAYTKSLAPLGLEQLSGHTLPGKGIISDLVGVMLERAEAQLPADLGLLMEIPALRQKVLKGNPSAIAGFALAQEDFSEALERVTAPTLIVWGELDQAAPLRTGYALDSLIPRSLLEVIPGGGHMTIRDDADRFVSLLRSHVDSTVDPALYRQQPAIGAGSEGQLSCSGRYGQQYTGRIERLVLDRCTDAVIRNAQIGALEITDSNVLIENSTITGGGTGIRSRGSTVYLTAGRVEGEVAIAAEASRFDIAGTELIGHRSAVEAVSDSSFIFSLGRIESLDWPDDSIHGYWLLGSGKRL